MTASRAPLYAPGASGVSTSAITRDAQLGRADADLGGGGLGGRPRVHGPDRADRQGGRHHRHHELDETSMTHRFRSPPGRVERVAARTICVRHEYVYDYT